MHSSFSIQDYHPRHHEAFRQLNMAWLNAYGLLEDHDLEVLDDPGATILDNGGYIYLALDGAKIIGSAALIRIDDQEFELAKMAVEKSYRSRGIGQLLLLHCMSKARSLGVKKLMLFSNHQLVAALALYEKNGFRHVAVKDSPFKTADVRMECIL